MPGTRPAVAPVETHESLEEPRELLGRQARPLVQHLEAPPDVRRAGAEPHLAAGRGDRDRVGEHVEEQLPQQAGSARISASAGASTTSRTPRSAASTCASSASGPRRELTAAGRREHCSAPLSARARKSRRSATWLMRSISSRMSATAAAASGSAPTRARSRSAFRRISESGVFTSCETSAAKRPTCSNADWSRSNIWFSNRTSVASSSRPSGAGMRSLRLSERMRLAVSAMCRSGRSVDLQAGRDRGPGGEQDEEQRQQPEDGAGDTHRGSLAGRDER